VRHPDEDEIDACDPYELIQAGPWPWVPGGETEGWMLAEQLVGGVLVRPVLPHLGDPGQAWHPEPDRAGGALAAPLGSSAITPQGSRAGLVVSWVWDGAPYRRWRACDHRVRIDVV
jgi:hypothetical protein